MTAAHVGSITACRVTPLTSADRVAWERLARGYHDFYHDTFPPAAYDATWQRLMDGIELFGVGAHVDGQLAGIAHYLVHPHVWRGTVCYLQDLYVDDQLRGSGVGRALMAHVADAARERGAFRLYWSTGSDNDVARRLYDKIATLTPFVRYDQALS